MPKLKLTIVTPVYNEEQVILSFHERTRAVLDKMEDVEARIVFVVDRSTDNTLALLRDAAAKDTRTRVLALSSRFGHQMSLLAGIENSLDADAIVMMDSDLQHPPELIPELVAHYRQGCDVVFTVRKDTEDASKLRKALGNLFYYALGRLSKTPINPNAADFRLISARVAKILASRFEERNMFMRGLFVWIGFKQIGIEYTAEKRFAGESKYSLYRMLKLALAGVLSFTTKPLHLGLIAGLLFAFIAVAFMAVVFVNYFLSQETPSGWTTLTIFLLMFSGVQLIVLGIMGAYIGGIYEEVKRRPRYLIEEDISHHE